MPLSPFHRPRPAGALPAGGVLAALAAAAALWPVALTAGCGSAPIQEATASPPLPSARHGHRLERLADGTLCFGGFGDARAADRGKRDTLWLADGGAAWEVLDPMPRGRAYFGSTVWNGAVFAIGGGMDRFDSDSRSWTPFIAAGELPDSHFGAAGAGGTAWVLGGFPVDRSGFFAIDLSEASIRRLPPPPGFAAGDHFHILHVLDGNLHVIGGLDAETFDPKAEHWLLAADGSWQALPPPPVPMWGKFAVHGVVGDAIVYHAMEASLRYTAANGWEPLPEPVLRRHFAMPAAVETPRGLWVLGGLPLNSGSLNDGSQGDGPPATREPAHLLLDRTTLRWTQLPGRGR